MWILFQLFLSFFLVFLPFVSPTHSAEERYGAYGLYPTGSTRVMAMGGAFAGLSDDVSGIGVNPGGLVTGEWSLDGGGNYNTVVNKEADLNGDGTRDGLPYRYFYFAGALNFKSFATGMGLSSPYAVELDFESQSGTDTETRNLDLAINGVDLPFSFRLNNHWSAGVTLHFSTLSEGYQYQSKNTPTNNRSVSTESQSTSATYGLTYRPKKSGSRWGFGVAYRTEQTFDVDSSLNSETYNGEQWFHGVVIPAKFVVGVFFKTSDRFLVVLDVDYYEKVSNAVYVGSELVPSVFNRVEVDSTDQLVAHGGFEWHAIDSQTWDFYYRMGTYREPPRLVGESARQHTTLGFELRLWALVFSASADSATDFINAAGGLGISLKPFL